MKKNKALASIGFLALFLAVLACGTPAEEWELRGWTPTPSPVRDVTQTPVLVEVTTVVQITVTPEPTAKPKPTIQIKLCVTAVEAVHLRPSPNLLGYPITTLESGAEVTDLGGRTKDGEGDFNWIFVQYRDARGWVREDYIGQCK